jgi:hypothetical protein
VVKAAPNQSLVSAKIISVEQTEQPNVFSVKLEIVNSTSIEGYENFLNRQVGKPIDAKIYSTKKLKPSQKPIKIILKYQGDEHGGIYYGSDGSIE